MFRSFATAIGISLVILGAECLAIEKAVLAKSKEAAPVATTQTVNSFLQEPAVIEEMSDFEPPEWAPWSLLTGGAVMVLYSLTLRKGG